MNNNEFYRFGSAEWATPADLRSAGLFTPGGPMIGFYGQRALFLENDAPLITFAGAGSGKLTTVASYLLCGYRADDGNLYAPARMFINDPRGELAAISIHNQVRLGKAAYCINPNRLHRLPSHRVNPWSMLKPNSPTLRADTKLLLADLITQSGSAHAEFFELRGREWSEFLTLWYVGKAGRITMPAFYDLMNQVVSETTWPVIYAEMAASADADIRRVADEIQWKRKNAATEFSGVISEILKAVSFMSDPATYDALNGEDFSLEVLCNEDCNVYLIIPAEYLAQRAPMIRAIVGAAMLYKFRHPQAERILFFIDEAATLGNFESLLRAYSYGRGMGVRVWSLWQNVEQIARNFGRDAIPAFVGSSQVRQFFGVRDLDTARMISAMLGAQTLEYDDDLAQENADLQRDQIIRELLNGADPILAGLNLHYQNSASNHRTKQQRLLMTPDEILTMPEDRQILYISGLNIKPICAHKYPYFMRREMFGHYLPNPHHKPLDRVRLGKRWARVITEPVPQKYAHLPQYQSGQWAFVEGYRPE